jgi:uncharacterized Fe-S center protein
MALVYFTDARSRSSKESLIEKLGRLTEAAGLEGIVKPGDKVFIKSHMGAPLTTRYLRPIYVRKVVEQVRSIGANPVVVETTGLGLFDPRGTAEKHLKVAALHGYTEEVIGAPILIADGETGLDATRAKGPKGDVFLAGRLREADALISLAHFKGHIGVAFGGALKNIAVGLSSKEGKFNFHYEAKPKVSKELCNSCQECLATCPVKGAIRMTDDKAEIVPDLCVGCLACVMKCGPKAIAAKRSEPRDLQSKMANMAAAVVNKVGKNKMLFVNFLLEVDWLCDCEHFQEGWSDAPIVPDIGIVASTDPIALDMASVDLVNKAPGIPGSKAEEVGALNAGTDKFRAIFPSIDWRVPLMAGEEIGLGKTEYELIQVG